MELGCDGVLMNTAVAHAQDPILMANAMKNAIKAGRDAVPCRQNGKKTFWECIITI